MIQPALHTKRKSESISTKNSDTHNFSVQRHRNTVLLSKFRDPSPTPGIPSPVDLVSMQESESSDFSLASESALDPEVKKIKEITSALNSGIKSKLRSYKKLNKYYSKYSEDLKKKASVYKDEFQAVKSSVVELVDETRQTQMLIQGLRSSFKNSKIESEDLVPVSTGLESTMMNTIKNLKSEIGCLKKKLDSNPAQNADDHIYDNKTIDPLFENTNINTSCKCYII